MRKLVLMCVVFFFGMMSLFAQKVEKVKKHKKAFITKRLDLTESESIAFWPVYDKFDENIYKLRVTDRKAYTKQIKEKGGVDNLTDIEAETILRELNALQEKLHHLEKEKYTALSQIISAKKMLKLHRSERAFRKKLLKKMKNNKAKPEGFQKE
jgi:hypothetical protein